MKLVFTEKIFGKHIILFRKKERKGLVLLYEVFVLNNAEIFWFAIFSQLNASNQRPPIRGVSLLIFGN